MDKQPIKLRCDCGKWVARVDENDDIYVWCSKCKKEVKLTPIKHDAKAKQTSKSAE